MTKVVGIKFERTPKVYFFIAGDISYEKDAFVLAETVRGIEIGQVARLPFDIDEESCPSPLKPVLRIAGSDDVRHFQGLKEKGAQALLQAREIVAKSGLDMKLIDAEYAFDSSKLVFYFTAENRVDFRDLVRELASTFKARIELRQVGIRDECKLKGGLGPCGRACCCCSHLNEFSQVTIKMAKNQALSLNPTKISGLCGRLMCCLSYENEHYAQTNKRMPKIGSEAETLDGKKGSVSAVNHIKETVTLRIAEKDLYTFQEFSLDNIKPKLPPKQ